jgi:hypothetical protein
VELGVDRALAAGDGTKTSVGIFLTIPISLSYTKSGKVVLSHSLKFRPIVFTGLKCVQCDNYENGRLFGEY